MSQKLTKSRQKIIIWLESTRQMSSLKRYGFIHYVSRKMKYAIMYVNQEDLEKAVEAISKLKYVRSVELSPVDEVNLTFDHVLDEVVASQNGKDEEDASYRW